MAETRTVLWTRILGRLAGPNPPEVSCVDPRETLDPGDLVEEAGVRPQL